MDLDGTLLDVSRRHYRVYRDIMDEFQKQPLEQERYWKLKRSKTSWDEVLRESQFPLADSKHFLDTFINRIELPKYLALDGLIHPKVKVALPEIISHADIYLASMRKVRIEVEHQMERLGLSMFFRQLVTPEIAETKTSMLTPFRTSGRMIFVGDTEEDIHSARELGATMIAVSSGLRSPEFLKRYRPDYIVDSVVELPYIIATSV